MVDWWWVWTASFVFFVARYALVAGVLSTAARACARRSTWRPLSSRPRVHRQLRLEISSSIVSAAIFVAVECLLVLATERGLTRVYWGAGTHGWGWFALSIVLMLALHDTYFYWTHRWMHATRSGWRTHAFHHQFEAPTPWSAFSLHPLEAWIDAGILPLIAFSIPAHPLALLLFSTFMTLTTAWLHLGYELWPRALRETAFGGMLMSATAHAAHHEGVRGNYGLYTTAWDVIMGTLEGREGAGRRWRRAGSKRGET